MYLPICLDISEKEILIVGGGKVARHKITSLLKFAPHIRVIAPEILPEVEQMASVVELRAYEKGDIKPHSLVYACTNRRPLNRQIKEDALEAGVLICVADDPKLCDFISPAVYKKDSMVVAVSSGGTDVKRSIRWRNRIGELFT